MSGGEWANCGQDTAIVEDWPCAVLCCVYASLAERCSSSKQFLDGSLMVSKRKRKRVNRIMVMMRNWRLSEANGDKTTRDEGFFFQFFALLMCFAVILLAFFFFCSFYFSASPLNDLLIHSLIHSLLHSLNSGVSPLLRFRPREEHQPLPYCQLPLCRAQTLILRPNVVAGVQFAPLAYANLISWIIGTKV